MGIRWEVLGAFGYHYALCTTEASFHKALKSLGIKAENFLIDGKDATAHHFVSERGKGCTIVTVAKTDMDRRIVYAALAHEAVHVWQNICSHIGESNPGQEIEAYHIQCIVQDFMHWYDELKG